MTRANQQIGTSTKKVTRGIGKGTLALRQAIWDTFQETGKPVTVRQMFYLVSVRGAVEKAESGYRKVQRQLLAMRREGWIPYGWIADNTRWMRKPKTWGSLTELFEYWAPRFRATLWRDIDAYVEVWCEKDALAGVLYDVTAAYDVPLMVARGYSSESYAHDAAEAIQEQGKPAFIYYVGDFDPSGWHMSRNLEAKLRGFGADIHFTRLGVMPWQVKAWNLPERETKGKDTRCKAFFAEFGKGRKSVELDAIPPDLLRQMVREAIESHIPEGALKAVEAEEEGARSALNQIAECWRES